MRLLLIGLISLSACRPAPRINLALHQACKTVVGQPPPPATCDQMLLGCANFIEVRLYQSDTNGALGQILQSSCLPASQLGQPSDLCALLGGHAPVALLDSLPDGKTVRFRLRAFWADPMTACNTDLPGAQSPLLLLDGFSAPVAIDGNDHIASIELGFCDACQSPPLIPPTCTTTRPDLPRGANPCCPQLTCAKELGNRCPNGDPALVGPGGCCGVCP